MKKHVVEMPNKDAFIAHLEHASAVVRTWPAWKQEILGGTASGDSTMSICSKHQKYDKDCKLCNTDIRELLPDFDKKLAEAKAAGEHTCEKCGFVYYLTVDYCPSCDTQAPNKVSSSAAKNVEEDF